MSDLLEEAKKAADRLCSDTSVPIEETLDELIELRDTVELMVQSLREDLEAGGR